MYVINSFPTPRNVRPGRPTSHLGGQVVPQKPENEDNINKRVIFILEELQAFLESYTEMHQVRDSNRLLPSKSPVK